MSSQTLDIEDLTVETALNGRRQVLVDNLSLQLRSGSVLALVGASGSGKSMTCSAALGVLPPAVSITRGRVKIDGALYEPRALRGRQIASIMQNPRSAFNPVRTMRDHAIETLRALGKLGADSDDRIADCMQAAGLDAVNTILGLHAFEMSGGMLQRMMIALALLTDAPFLFADEPTTDLDLVVQLRVLDLLEKLVVDRGLGVLLVTHDMGVVARLANEVAVMEQGRVIERADAMDIFHRPQQEVTRLLVNAHLALYGMEATA